MSKTNKNRQKTDDSLSFIHFLERSLRTTPPRQKGERTRERLKIATAKMLEAKGYHATRVVDITETAGVAEGSFYVYYSDKKEASLAALSAFFVDFVDLVAPLEAVRAPFDYIRAANRRWLSLCRSNAGLMRCVLQLGDEDKDFSRLVQRTVHQWYAQVAQNLCHDKTSSDPNTTLLAVYFMGSMMDELVRKLIVMQDKEFLKLVASLKMNDNALADAASLIWIRVFDGDAKTPKDLPSSAVKLAQLMWKN